MLINIRTCVKWQRSALTRDIDGCCKDIRNFQDPWLRGKSVFRVEDHHSLNSRNDKVYEFICPNIKAWKIRSTFHPDDVVCILKTIIP